MAWICRRVLDFASSMGLVLANSLPDTEPQYQPITRTIFGNSNSDVIHEIAHYLVATPRERELPNFGLGSGPDGGRSTPVKATAYKDRERDASILGIFCEREFGFLRDADEFSSGKLNRGYMDTWRMHSWGETQKLDVTALASCRRLLAGGQLVWVDGCLRPQVLL